MHFATIKLIKYIFCTFILIQILLLHHLDYHVSSLINKLLFDEPDVERFSYWLNANRDLKLYVKLKILTSLQEPRWTKRPVYLLVIVCSASQNFEARQAIRSTWGNISKFDYQKYLEIVYQHGLQDTIFSEPEFPKKSYRTRSLHNFYKFLFNYDYDKYRGDYRKYDLKIPTSINKTTVGQDQLPSRDVGVRILFMLGVNNVDAISQDEIRLENKLFGDIIQEDFLDTYQNLSVKTGMMLKWISKNCRKNVKYIMKTDDDVYVNLYKLVFKLQNMKKPHELLLGKLISNDQPSRYKQGKFYSPVHMYPHDFHPNFLSGSAFVMSMDTALKIYQIALNMPIYHLDDVYYTGLCALVAGIPVVNSRVFTNEKVFMGYCEFSYHATSHNLNPGEMYLLASSCDKYDIFANLYH